MKNNLLELIDVTAKIGNQSVIRNLSLQLQNEQRLAIMGPSGAGKSTLLRILAGLQAVDSGAVILEGQPIQSVAANKRSMALLTQDYALYPQLTVEANLKAAIQAQNLNRDEVASRCNQVIELFEIGDLLDRLPSQISGGQAQRVAFAKALVRQPKLLLLDEPLSQLDSSLRSQLLQAFITACELMKTCVCWVTHDPREAFQVASRILVLNQGGIEQEGSSTEIYSSPKSRVVASVSSCWPVNFWALNQAQAKSLLAYAVSSATWAGIRAESIVLTTKESSPRNGWPCWQMRVSRIDYLGFTKLIVGAVGDTPISVVGDHDLTVGQIAEIAVDPSKILWF